MNRIFGILIAVCVIVSPALAQQKKVQNNAEAGARVGAALGETKKIQQEAREWTLRNEQAKETKYVDKKLQRPGKGNTYDLSIQANAQDVRKLNMNGKEYRMTGVSATPNMVTNTYQNPQTKDKITVQRLSKNHASDTWANITSSNTKLPKGEKLETKMPVKGRKNEWIISSSNGGNYLVRRYIKNEDGSVTVLSANRGTVMEGDFIDPTTIRRGTFQSVQNADINSLTQNMPTTECKLGSDCY